MIKDDPTIGLYGIEGVYNYGCEAIVRGTEIILRKIWPDVTIKYVSPRPEDDKRRLQGCDVNIVPRKIHPLWSIKRLTGIFNRLTGFYLKDNAYLPFRNSFQEDLSWIKECDAIFSIGGDLYTLPPNYKEPKNRYHNPLIHFGEVVKAYDKKLIIWGASIGPFEGYPQAKTAFIDHLKHTDLITSREPATTKYLKSLGIKNVIECADPAFTVTTKKDVKKNDLNPKLHIGINLSPLSTISIFKSDIDNVIKKQAELITFIVKELDAHVTLIPHVVSNFDVNDDDLRYLKLVKSQINAEVIDQVDLIEDDVGFIGTNQILSSCDVVIAARMHCAINALSIGVPTIFLAYSRKAYGMAEYIYGDDKWVIPLQKKSDNEVLEKLHSILIEKNNINIFLNEKMKTTRLATYQPITKVDQII